MEGSSAKSNVTNGQQKEHNSSWLWPLEIMLCLHMNHGSWKVGQTFVLNSRSATPTVPALILPIAPGKVYQRRYTSCVQAQGIKPCRMDVGDTRNHIGNTHAAKLGRQAATVWRHTQPNWGSSHIGDSTITMPICALDSCSP